MRVLLGITGGIAAYKSASLIRLLTEAGHEVKVLPTQNALRFIGSATLEALSHNTVDSDLYSEVETVKHISLAKEADLVIVAPATASFMARFANGLADDLLLNVLLATKAPIVLAPAMHTEMWLNEATQENLTVLQSRGVHIVQPTSGRLTGEDSGVGRMAEPEQIFSTALSIATKGLDLAGKRVVVVAGGTREPIDAVRFIGNSSSGKQGIELAKAATARGAKVKIIAANIDLELPSVEEVVRVTTTSELEHALQEIGDCDLLLMPAAVSDFRVEAPFSEKISRTDNPELNLRLISNPDLIHDFAESRRTSSPLIVGFAAVDEGDFDKLVNAGRQKLLSKGIELVVANDISNGNVFGSENNDVAIISLDEAVRVQGTKREVADSILDRASALL